MILTSWSSFTFLLLRTLSACYCIYVCCMYPDHSDRTLASFCTHTEAGDLGSGYQNLRYVATRSLSVVLMYHSTPFASSLDFSFTMS